MATGKQPLFVEFGDLTLDDLRRIVHVSLIRPFPPLPWANFLNKTATGWLATGKQVPLNGHLDSFSTSETTSMENEIDGSCTREVILCHQTHLQDDDLSKIIEVPKKSWAALDVPKKSWAALAKSNINANFVPQSTIVSVNAQEPTNIFQEWSISHVPFNPIPRGLINNGNQCFMNCVLQPLVYCSPFVNMIIHFTPVFRPHTLLYSLKWLIKEFKQPVKKTEKQKKIKDAFSPEFIYEAMRMFVHTISSSSFISYKVDIMKGRQEDAEEFLNFMLEILDKELNIILNSLQGLETLETDESGEWIEVDRKHKAVTTRTVKISNSPIARLFAGRIKSIVKCHGVKDSATLEPFQTLSLDITSPDVSTLDDSFKKISEIEVIEGFSSTGKTASNITKQNFIESLPPILIIQLKRLVYDPVTNTTQKLQKHINYPVHLVINPLSPLKSQKMTQYKYNLVSVVNHHGKLAAGGHYTCDVLSSEKSWLRFDDDQCFKITEEQVVEEKSDRQAYMLFYIQE